MYRIMSNFSLKNRGQNGQKKLPRITFAQEISMILDTSYAMGALKNGLKKWPLKIRSGGLAAWASTFQKAAQNFCVCIKSICCLWANTKNQSWRIATPSMMGRRANFHSLTGRDSQNLEMGICPEFFWGSAVIIVYSMNLVS